MPRRLAALLLLLSTATAGDHGRWIEQLADPAARERARRVLLAQGTPALAELRAARDAAAAPERRRLLDALIAEIERREPHGLRFRAGVPKMKLTLDFVNGKEFAFHASVDNRGEETVVLWPYLALRVLDAEGEEVAPRLRIGRHGLRTSDGYLEDVDFITLEPGDTWAVQATLHRYLQDPSSILGWELPGPGRYTLELTYAYDRAEAKKPCDPDWEPLDDPARPWNRALELRRTFTAEMRVDP